MDRDDNVVVTGDSYTGAFPHFYTAKYAASNGALLWGTYYDGPDNRGGDVGTLVIDRLGNVVISGAVYNGVTSPGFYTAMYAAANGSLSWEKYFSGPGTWKDVRISNHSLALGPDGMIVVAGISAFQYSLDFDFATIAYRVENLLSHTGTSKRIDPAARSTSSYSVAPTAFRACRCLCCRDEIEGCSIGVSFVQ